MQSKSFDLIVIGEGIAGLSAACSAAEAGMRTAIFEAALCGGMITNINVLDPSPDIAVTSGAELVVSFVEESARLGVESFSSLVRGIEQNSDFFIRAGEGSYQAKRLIIASGARPRGLGVQGETTLSGRGLSHCADCDGPLYRGRSVVVVGGGDSAVQGALVLAQFCAHVHIINRASQFTGRAELSSRALSNPKISVSHSSELERISGKEALEKVSVRHLKNDQLSEIICSGLFVYVGLVPNTDFLPPSIALDGSRHIITDDGLETSLGGVFAVGAVRKGFGGTLADAITEGRAAGEAVASALM